MENCLRLHCPAKINLTLAVTGRRSDGFHDLVSLVCPVEFGDDLAFVAGGEGFALSCTDPALPVGADNLVVKAADAFASRRPEVPRGRFVLEKRIPVGAGLGGGSSDAAGALLLLEAATGLALGSSLETAAAVGSDVALFLARGACVMRGRGERLEPVPAGWAASWDGQPVLLFKPPFGVATPWAYGELVRGAPATYTAPAAAEESLAAALSTTPGSPLPGGNSFEPVVFAKYPAIEVLFGLLRERLGLQPRLSGSGSCSFLFPPNPEAAEAAEALVRESWGPAAFIAHTRLRASR